MTKPELAGIMPFFVSRNVPAAIAFYRDRLGFDVMFQGPEPDDIFFGIVTRGRASIMLKDIGVEPVPNYTVWKPLHDNSDDLRGFEVRDADGYVLYFGRPNPK